MNQVQIIASTSMLFCPTATVQLQVQTQMTMSQKKVCTSKNQVHKKIEQKAPYF